MKTRVEPVRYADIASSRELDDFLEIVRNLLNVQIGFSPVGSTVGGQPVLARPRAAENPLCHMIRAAPGGLAACLACDKKHGDDAIQTRRGIHYVCHAGLVDFFVPVAIDNRIVGILSGGQVLPEPPTRQGFERLRKRLAKLGIGSTELRDAYFKSPFLPMEKAEATLKLITLFTELIAERGGQGQAPEQGQAARLPENRTGAHEPAVQGQRADLAGGRRVRRRVGLSFRVALQEAYGRPVQPLPAGAALAGGGEAVAWLRQKNRRDRLAERLRKRQPFQPGFQIPFPPLAQRPQGQADEF